MVSSYYDLGSTRGFHGPRAKRKPLWHHNQVMNPTVQLKDAFVKALTIDPGIDFDSLAYGTTEGWDSVAHMGLVAEIEAAFDIMLSTDDLIAMSSFGKAKEIVSRYGITFDA
jgi:acyl carrier protein